MWSRSSAEPKGLPFGTFLQVPEQKPSLLAQHRPPARRQPVDTVQPSGGGERRTVQLWPCRGGVGPRLQPSWSVVRNKRAPFWCLLPVPGPKAVRFIAQPAARPVVTPTTAYVRRRPRLAPEGGRTGSPRTSSGEFAAACTSAARRQQSQVILSGSDNARNDSRTKRNGAPQAILN